MKYQAKLPMDKQRCNNLDMYILYNFKGNITWESYYKQRDIDCVVYNVSNPACNETTNANGTNSTNATMNTTKKFDQQALVSYNKNVNMTQMEVLDARFRCYLNMLDIP
jgi:hypothetical protein